MKHSSAFDIRLSKAEAVVLYELIRRLGDEPEFIDRLNPSEKVVVASLGDVLDDALHAKAQG